MTIADFTESSSRMIFSSRDSSLRSCALSLADGNVSAHRVPLRNVVCAIIICFLDNDDSDRDWISKDWYQRCSKLGPSLTIEKEEKRN